MTQDQGRVPCRTVSTAQVARGADRHSFNGYSHFLYHSPTIILKFPPTHYSLTAGSPPHMH